MFYDNFDYCETISAVWSIGSKIILGSLASDRSLYEIPLSLNIARNLKLTEFAVTATET